MSGARYFMFEKGEIARLKELLTPHWEGPDEFYLKEYNRKEYWIKGPDLPYGELGVKPGLTDTSGWCLSFRGNNVLHVEYNVHGTDAADAMCSFIRDNFKLKRTGSEAVGWYKSVSEIKDVEAYCYKLKMFGANKKEKALYLGWRKLLMNFLQNLGGL